MFAVPSITTHRSSLINFGRASGVAHQFKQTQGNYTIKINRFILELDALSLWQVDVIQHTIALHTCIDYDCQRNTVSYTRRGETTAS